MKNGTYSIAVDCPWCGRGETLADRAVEVNISCRCFECGSFYNVDLLNRRAVRAQSKPTPKANAPNKKTREL